MKQLLAPAPLPAWIAIGFLVLIAPAVPRWKPEPPPQPQFAWWAVKSRPGPQSERTADPGPTPRTVLEHGRARRLATETLHDWVSDDDGAPDPDTFRLGGVTVTLASAATERAVGGSYPVGLMLHVSAPGVRTRTLTFDSHRSRTDFGVGRVDAVQAGPQLLFTTDSGGSGCCTTFYLLTAKNGRWRLDRLGRWDLGLAEWPRDRNGDGAPEFAFHDARFIDYPKSPHPRWFMPEYVQVRNGKAVDVSTHPAFAGAFQAVVRETLPECRKGDNHACKAFVAAASRIGRRDWAWKIMLKSYDRQSDVRFWVDCDKPEARKACETPETLYPFGLKAFLEESGYF